MNNKLLFSIGRLAVFFCLLCAVPVFANSPGGGTSGANVTLTDNGSTVTLANGIISIVITKADASIHTINYTFNNTGTPQTLNVLANGYSGGKLYYENSSDQGCVFTYAIVTSPANNGGNYAEIVLSTTTVANVLMEIHYSLLRGNTGFYVTPIWFHRSTDDVFSMGECRDNIYSGSIFNWMSVDATRNKLMPVSGGSAIGVQGAPVEVSLWTSGIYAGLYEDKYKYSADYALQHAWGWSSVGAGGKNVGLWDVMGSAEYYPGGPMKRELMCHMGTTILNTPHGSHFGGGTDSSFGAGEVWAKVCGPHFIYCNNITNAITATNTAAQALFTDALAQATAESAAWPYAWFTNANYALASGRGAVTGKIVIADSFNPNASASNLWVGVEVQPTANTTVTYDFQKWYKPYQFWTRTDANGNFTIPKVIAATNYTLYAFGPGAAGTFQSQAQSGGSAPNELDIPASPFSVTVTAGATNNLGVVTWTPVRVGPTVFEIGYPDRTAAKFRHGEDWWVGDIGPSASVPSPIWSKWLEFPFDFPNGVNYAVGQSRWTTDWFFCQPVVTDAFGNYNNSSATITFNLPAAPVSDGSFYLALSSDLQAAIIITVNGNLITSSIGYYTAYSGSSDQSDATIREGIHGLFSDYRSPITASYLHQGQNTITISIRQTGGTSFSDNAMYDYLRLEVPGYIPPPPANARAFAGNNCNLVTWPVVPGATSYNILRSTTNGSGYVSVTNGVTGPVCGSGAVNATWLDTSALNGTNYYYVVRAANPVGNSTNSPPSSVSAPAAGIAATAPAAPTGLAVGSTAHQSVTLNWSASAGANFYTVYRSTLFNNGGGASNVLGTILLNNAVTNTTYTDASPNDGSIYRYVVTATSAGGTSTNSAPAAVVPLPTTPGSPPRSLTGSFASTSSLTLNWIAVPGAIGYVISRATSASGPFTYLQTVTQTTYTDYTVSSGTIYYYRVAAMNAAGVSGNNTDLVNSQQTYPPSLTATATNAQITLSWAAATGATNYTLKRGTSAGGENVTVVSGYTGTTYTNTGLANGTTYYYVVTATGAGGTSGNSPEASATPLVIGNGIWISTASGNWGAATNWVGSSIAAGAANSADFSTLSLSSNLTVTLDSARTIGSLIFGDTTATYNWTLAGTNTLTLGTSPVINVENQSATITTPLAGTAGLSKIGLGALILGGASNSFAGGTTVNAGSLALDFSAANSPASNLIASANSLTLGGGALQITGSSNAASSQTFSATTLNAGASVISAAPVSGANIPTVAMGAISTTLNAGDLVEFVGPATTGAGGASVAATANITTGTAGGSGLISNYAIFGTVGLYDYAATAGSSSPYPVVGASQVSGFYTTYAGGSGGPTGGNVDLTGTAIGWGGIPYLQSLRFNTGLGANQSVNNNSSYTTLQAADILVTPNVGTYNVTFNISSLRPNTATGGNGPEIVWQNNTAGELIINSTINRPNHSTTYYDDAYEQAGSGTVVLNNPGNNYTGQSYLNGGVTLIAGNGSLGVAANGAAVNLNGGTLTANGTFALDSSGANQRPVYLSSNGGGLATTAGNTLTVDGYIGGAGSLTIGIPASSANNNTAGLLPGTGSGTANAAVNATGTVVLNSAGNGFAGGTVLSSGTVNINSIWALGGAVYGGLTFAGGNLQYAATLLNTAVDITQDTSAGGTGLAGGAAKTVTLAANATIDVNGNTIAYTNTLGNGGSGSLTVKSSLAGGSLNFQSANNYSGSTTVTNATLAANNANGSATGSGDVFVQNAGVLSGNGTVAGSVTVAAGGTLTVGNGTDSFTIGNNLTLNAGSTTTLQIQHSPLANSSMNVGNNLAFGGALVVTNLGGALTNGDSFQLFSAANFSGTFASLTLPTLATNLFWNTNALKTSGVLAVVTPTPPVIGSLQITGTNLVLAGGGGLSGWPYLILTTTNILAPQWTPVVTNQFDVNGNFSASLTNLLDAGHPTRYFRVKLP